MDRSNTPRNCSREVWYMQFTMDISQIKKYKILPRVATGRNSSRASFILASVSAATDSFSLTSDAVSLVIASTCIRDSSSTSEPCNHKSNSYYQAKIKLSCRPFHWPFGTTQNQGSFKATILTMLLHPCIAQNIVLLSLVTVKH